MSEHLNPLMLQLLFPRYCEEFFGGEQPCYFRSASARVIFRVISVAAQSVAATSVCYHKRGSPRLLLKDGSGQTKTNTDKDTDKEKVTLVRFLLTSDFAYICAAIGADNSNFKKFFETRDYPQSVERNACKSIHS